MDISHSNRSCPVCKCQLKKEEFQELTSEVCSICQNKPKFPVLTTSGSLSCWACHYKSNKTQCDQVIPIYGTEDESEEKADPAVPPRPVLQRDVVIEVSTTMNNSRPVGDNPTNYTIRDFMILIGCVGLFAVMIFPMTSVFFLPWLLLTESAHYAICGCFVVGELLSIICFTLRLILGKKDILADLYRIVRLISIIFCIIILAHIEIPTGSFSEYWLYSNIISQFTFFCSLFAM
jgi:hypothetical protein